MKFKFLIFLIFTALSLKVSAQHGFPFDNEIQAFKHQDSLHFPKAGGILFIGSSSIRMWDDLELRFPAKPIIKRGVGGSELSQLVKYYTPYILFPYKPRKIFIYAGENDIAAGKTADSVVRDFKILWRMIRQKLPGTSIYFLSIKPSPSRIKFLSVVNSANASIKTFLRHKSNSKYIDVSTVILKPDTSYPDSSLFKSDYLHLNSKGYDRWQKALQPYVK